MPEAPVELTLEEYHRSEDDTLKPAKVYLYHEDTPPPGLAEDSKIEPEEHSEGEKVIQPGRRPRSGTIPSFADHVLINHLGGGGYLDVAEHAGRRALTPTTSSERDDPSGVGDEEAENNLMRDLPPTAKSSDLDAVTRAAPSTLSTAGKLQDVVVKEETTTSHTPGVGSHILEHRVKSSQSPNGTLHNAIADANGPREAGGSDLPEQSPRNQCDVLPLPRHQQLAQSIELPPLRVKTKEEEEKTTMSPSLSKFTIRDGDPDSTLPKLLHSPPRTNSSTSVESRRTLPSLHTTLSSISDSSCNTPFTAQSPNFNRLPSTFSSFGPSPSSYGSPNAAISPPRGISSAPSLWRTSRDTSSMSTPSEYACGNSSIPTPVSSVLAGSPDTAYHVTPTTVTSENSPLDVSNVAIYNDHEHSPFLDGELSESIPFAAIFKCSYPGCTAAPFQTQYLLNSHANVHSNTRPHFCPVKNCPRGPGGQGFKRKNEMIRHGLVHTSPGYVCPFCQDQQHKYPRPDNLQRHVRVHHVDKDRDDPVLRDVLAQRPEGGNRGRRRRLGS